MSPRVFKLKRYGNIKESLIEVEFRGKLILRAGRVKLEKDCFVVVISNILNITLTPYSISEEKLIFFLDGGGRLGVGERSYLLPQLEISNLCLHSVHGFFYIFH